MPKLKVEGFRELDKVLAELPAATARRVSRAGMIAALEPVAATARSLAPRGSESKNARMADSIGVSDKLTRRQAREARRLFREGKTVQSVYVGVGDPVAHLVEFGSGPRQHKSGKSTGIMPAQPFMRPAWDQNRQAVLDSLAQHLREQIDAVLARRALREARRQARAAKRGK